MTREEIEIGQKVWWWNFGSQTTTKDYGKVISIGKVNAKIERLRSQGKYSYSPPEYISKAISSLRKL